MSPPAAELVVSFFTICNILRLVAYFPQLMCVIRDRKGATAVSCWSWMLFSLANGSTVVYAGFVLHDRVMMVIFMANTLASSAILVMTLVRRRDRRAAMSSATFASPKATG